MINQVTVGHCLEVLKRIPDKSVHCCVTSPPYFALRDYQLPPALWPEVSFSPMPGLPPLHVPEQESCLGLEKDIWAYVGHMVAVFREVWRVMRDDGTLWLNLGDSYASNGEKQTGRNDNGRPEKDRGWAEYDIKRTKTKIDTGLKPKDLMGIPWRVAYALQADGWYLRSDVIWHKPNPMPESVTDRPTKAHEYVFLFSKSERYFYDIEATREPIESNGKGQHFRNSKRYIDQKIGTDNSDHNGNIGKANGYNSSGRNRRTVWTVATQSYEGAHFATFPTRLIEPMILASTSEQGVCGNCGAQWVREVEKRTATPGQNPGYNAATGMRNDGDRAGHWVDQTSITTGWRPSCSCNAPIAPAIVLDPFGGSGTTGKVALANRRNFILIDANPVYAEELATERLNGTQIKLV